VKRDDRYQRDIKRKRCRRRAAIEPIIGHLKIDLRFPETSSKVLHAGDIINLLMSVWAWNMAKWMRPAVLFLFALIFRLKRVLRNTKTELFHTINRWKRFLGDFAESRNQTLRTFSELTN